jgi:hypothetical protein
MKIARLAGLVLAAVMALSLVAVSVASATEPLFNPTSGTLTALTGEATLLAENGALTVTCQKSVSPGTIVSKDLALLVVHFLECKGAEGAETPCSVHSEGAPAENLILTKTLHAILGLVLPHVPAILLLPTASKEFVTLEAEKGKTCISTIAVTGNVTGEVSPIGSKQITGKIVFGVSVNKHFISSLGLLTLAKLVAGSNTANEITNATIDFGQLTEVT